MLEVGTVAACEYHRWVGVAYRDAAARVDSAVRRARGDLKAIEQQKPNTLIFDALITIRRTQVDDDDNGNRIMRRPESSSIPRSQMPQDRPK